MASLKVPAQVSFKYVITASSREEYERLELAAESLCRHTHGVGEKLDRRYPAKVVATLTFDDDIIDVTFSSSEKHRPLVDKGYEIAIQGLVTFEHGQTLMLIEERVFRIDIK